MQNRNHCLAGPLGLPTGVPVRAAKLPARRRNSGRGGFTLVEVMLVLVILMTLATFGVFAVRTFWAEAKKREAAARLGEYAGALEHYYTLYECFPATQEGLDALRNCPPSLDPSDYKPVITGDIKLDPWGSPYNYEYPGSNGVDDFDLWSNGPDMQSGTQDDIWFKR